MKLQELKEARYHNQHKLIVQLYDAVSEIIADELEVQDAYINADDEEEATKVLTKIFGTPRVTNFGVKSRPKRPIWDFRHQGYDVEVRINPFPSGHHEYPGNYVSVYVDAP